jgi:hypothetical protein
MKLTSALLLFAMSCASAPVDRAADVRALLAMHEQILQAHRDSNVDHLLANAVDRDFVMGNRGVVSYPSLAQRKDRLGPYLRSTRFSVYRDQVPPIVKVSADGTLGWVIVQIEARGEQTTESGTTEHLEFQSAWIELYEKRDGRWVAIGNLSNFK